MKLPLGAVMIVVLALLSAPLASEAQSAGAVPRIALLSTECSPDAPAHAAFRQALRDLGYVEGKDIIIEWRLGLGWHEERSEVSLPISGETPRWWPGIFPSKPDTTKGVGARCSPGGEVDHVAV